MVVHGLTAPTVGMFRGRYVMPRLTRRVGSGLRRRSIVKPTTPPLNCKSSPLGHKTTCSCWRGLRIERRWGQGRIPYDGNCSRRRPSRKWLPCDFSDAAPPRGIFCVALSNHNNSQLEKALISLFLTRASLASTWLPRDFKHTYKNPAL
jgi:hypothetical protein